MGFTSCAPRSLMYNQTQVGRDRCCQCRSPLNGDCSQTAEFETADRNHTFVCHRWRADLDIAIPQSSVVISQWDAAGITLARWLDINRKGVVRAGILFICSRSALNLPAKMTQMDNSPEQLGKSGRNLRDRFHYFLTRNRLYRVGEQRVATLGNRNCNPTRRGRLGQWDGRGEEGESGKDEGEKEVHG